MKALRIIAKVLLFPLTLLLTIFVKVSMFVVERCAGILNLLSGIVFIGALAGYTQYLFGWPFGTAGEMPSLQLAIFATVFGRTAFSPIRLPI